MYQTLLTEVRDGLLVITINRPDKLNALNKTVMEELDRAVDALIADASLAGAVITGAGPKAFVAGADIKEFVGLSVAEGKALAQKGQNIFFKIERSPKPIVAAVNGFALGGGCELAMACHFRIASDHAKFGQPEVNLGLIPGYGGTQRLTQLIGKGRAIELIITGATIDAATARQYGLVNDVVAADALLDRALSILQGVRTKAPLAVAQAIAAANAAYTEDGFAREIEGFGACFGTNDLKEGTAAFLEKRRAEFKGN
ncbi:enoyl-CoA hydratase/isomerase family protein [Dinghuibacter silviterrae]|uniref:Enoyl-CoA hydratase n=1 Tax=Dinghuibacter silviterrae TaxID=1539049 RepID=A0A4R8DMX4_9BACT|nr:enoyl-CoA hydratase-related protein [Dinghuibacter silviterrae]TDW99359.1 enoyl-CoA hydratase [Dinghuibacter silviterrae]